MPHIKPPMPRFGVGANPEAKGPKRGRASLVSSLWHAAFSAAVPVVQGFYQTDATAETCGGSAAFLAARVGCGMSHCGVRRP